MFVQLSKSLLMIILSVLLSACMPQSFLLDRGKDSFQHQNYREAYLRLKPLAKQGNADAQYALGYLLFNGQGVVEDQREALYWIKAAAKQNQIQAIRALQLLTSKSSNQHGK